MVTDGQDGEQYDSVGVLVFSPDSRRIAYGARNQNKAVVIVDGKPGKQYDHIWRGDIIFSPDSKRVMYVAIEGDKRIVVVDGNESERYELTGQLTFSPDSRRVVYSAQLNKKWFLVVDGNGGKTFDDIGMRYLTISPYDADLSNEHLLVIDEFIMNKDGKKYRIISTRQGDIVFDGTHSFHYLALRDKKVYLVEERIDGK